jgi:ABC-type polysaccharide/polyol phosphate transport system ATPase subunit
MPSSDVAIRFENVSKCYVRHPRTIRDTLSLVACRLGLGKGSTDQATDAEFWAVRDATFQVERGETVGIIGENGAGKSTILKLIAGITVPTSGSIRANGRLATLIELGAGFNQDLTGRENIYLNGAVLGLSRREIDESFDRIVAFSGLAEFLDMPVKYYSSGMYARLGFSIASHVRADVILTDEILAVGDAAFQRQCLNKFQEIKASSTVLFVSHDLAAIKKVCTRVLWLMGGRIQLDGSSEEVVEAYLESLQQEREVELRTGRLLRPKAGATRWGSGEIEIEEVLTHDGQGRAKTVFRTYEDLVICLHYRIKGPFRDPGFCVQIHSDNEVWLHGTNTFIHGSAVKPEPGVGVIEVRYPRLPLLAGTYWIMAGVASGNDWSAPYDVRMKVQRFDVLTAQPDGGLVCLDHQWSGTSQGERMPRQKEQ